jgi:hypothetical protein
MSMTALIALNVVLDLAIVAALAAVMRAPLRLDRRTAPVSDLPRATGSVELAA